MKSLRFLVAAAPRNDKIVGFVQLCKALKMFYHARMPLFI